MARAIARAIVVVRACRTWKGDGRSGRHVRVRIFYIFFSSAEVVAPIGTVVGTVISTVVSTVIRTVISPADFFTFHRKTEAGQARIQNPSTAPENARLSNLFGHVRSCSTPIEIVHAGWAGHFAK